MTGYRVWVENNRGDDYYYFFKKSEKNKAKALAIKLKREGRLNDVTLGDSKLTLKSKERGLTPAEKKDFWNKIKRKTTLKRKLKAKAGGDWITKETNLSGGW